MAGKTDREESKAKFSPDIRTIVNSFSDLFYSKMWLKASSILCVIFNVNFWLFSQNRFYSFKPNNDMRLKFAKRIMKCSMKDLF